MTDHQNPFADWKAPLYDSARNHLKEGTVSGLWRAAMEFSFLGPYRDCQQQLRMCLDDLKSRYSDQKEKALHARNFYSSVKAVNELKEFEKTGFSDYEAAAARAEERKNLLFEKTKRKNRTILLIKIGCLAAALLFIMGMAFYVMQIMQPELRKQALSLEADEDYTGALEIYRKLLLGPYAGEAGEKIPYLKKQYGYQMIGQGNYELAVETLEKEADQEGVEKARYAWGNSLFEQGEYKEALLKIKPNRVSEQKRETYLTWSDDLENKEEYNTALKVLRQMELDFAEDEEKKEQDSVLAYLQKSEEERSGEQAEMQRRQTEELKKTVLSDLNERRPRLREERCEKAVRTIAGSASIDADLAYSLGSEIDDLAGLLRYCIALDEAGADLESIFSEGVSVIDVSLQEYNPAVENKGLFRDDSSIAKDRKVLVFSREEKKERTEYLVSDWYRVSSGMSKREDKNYMVRMLPGSWQKLSKEQRAAGMEDCELIVLADTIYLNEDKDYVTLVNEVRIRVGETRQTIKSTTYYPLFDAVDNVTIYDKENPDHFYVADYQRTGPENTSNSSISGLPLVITARNGQPPVDYNQFWGKSDKMYLKRALQRTMDLF